MTSTHPFSPRTPPPPVALPGPMAEVVDAPAPPELEPEEPRPPRDRPRWLVPLSAAVLAVALGAVIAGWFLTRDEVLTSEQVQEAVGEALSSTTVPDPVGPAVYATVLPSLAFIQNGEAGTEGSSIGSGVIINADGLIMTSNHVVAGSSDIVITFTDGTTSAATVVESDPAIDIAVLQAQTLPEVVVPAVLGGGVQIGEPIYALGNPLGLGGSFSAGVVSGLNRTLPLPNGDELTQLIQFDAAVNPGSSGGPLVDANAQVVGIVTAIANPTGEDFFSGIGFAVPIATAGGAAGGPEQ
ncbi:MAG: trypsin-like peptidase domain-containing protein [Acidimicrobiia bacterium]|nr:trypsin-like peptidase domain-containing protein [Acidimicrobiia bacterium]